MGDKTYNDETYRCLDCYFENREPEGQYCEHFTPEYWERRGFKRGWGDAAVMNWPHMEILVRVEQRFGQPYTEFVILAPHATRRPVILDGYGDAWGGIY